MAPVSNTSPSVLFLNGFPGVGKSSIAQAVCKELLHSRLLDNHLYIDLAQAIEPERTPAHYEFRMQLLDLACERLLKLEDRAITIVVTSCLASGLAQDLDVFRKFVGIARGRHVPFVSVNVLCDEDENMRRLRGEGRNARRGKLTDEKILADLRSVHTLLDAGACDAETAGVEVHELELDTTQDTTQDAAEKVLGFLKAVIAGTS